MVRVDPAEELPPPAEDVVTLSYEAALEATLGNARAQRRLLLLCGLGNAADAAELLSVSLVLPAVGPDGRGSLRLTVEQLSLLSASLFVGALLGTLLFGAAADALGRRHALAVAMAISGLFGLLSAFSTTFSVLLLLRTVAGVGVGGSVPVVFAFVAELCPVAIRGRYLCGVAACWMVGSVATALAGLALVPWAPANGWRFFVAVASLPSLACASLSATLAPADSPRWLLTHGRVDEATAVMRKVAAQNGCPAALPAGCTLAAPKAPAEHGTGGAWRAQRRALRSLLTPPLRSTTLGTCVVWFGLSFGWYGTVLWFPEFFKERAETAAATPPPPGPATGPLPWQPFAEQLAVAASNLPGNLLSL